MVGMLILSLLYTLSGILEHREFPSGSSEAELWLACMVAAPGVWIRWWLARFNGRGFGKAALFKWIPFGTLIANVGAACVMAGLSTVKKAVRFLFYPSLDCLWMQFISCTSIWIKSCTNNEQENFQWGKRNIFVCKDL